MLTMRDSSFRAVVAIAALLAVTSFAQADPILIFNTGVDGSGTVLADGTLGDPHYILFTVPVGSTTVIRARRDVGGYPLPPDGPYIGDDLLSDWIGPNNSGALGGPAGLYDYRTTFSLSGLDPATATLSGFWSTDNEGISILLNGVATGNTIPSPTSYTSFHSFSITTGFIAGTNTLDFIVNNDESSTALRVEVTGTASQVPEPGTLALLGLGFAGLGLSRRRH
jgi:hypothetical protein